MRIRGSRPEEVLTTSNVDCLRQIHTGPATPMQGMDLTKYNALPIGPTMKDLEDSV